MMSTTTTSVVARKPAMAHIRPDVDPERDPDGRIGTETMSGLYRSDPCSRLMPRAVIPVNRGDR